MDFNFANITGEFLDGVVLNKRAGDKNADDRGSNPSTKSSTLAATRDPSSRAVKVDIATDASSKRKRSFSGTVPTKGTSNKSVDNTNKKAVESSLPSSPTGESSPRRFSLPFLAPQTDKVEVLHTSPKRANSHRNLNQPVDLVPTRSCPVFAMMDQSSNKEGQASFDSSTPPTGCCNASDLQLAVCFGGETSTEDKPTEPAVVEEQALERQDSKALAPAKEKTKTSTKFTFNKYGERKHLSWFGHGKLWTGLALFFAWTGCLFAVLSRLSTKFVHLEKPFDVSPQYMPVQAIGMIRMEICLNSTMMNDSRCSIIRLSPDEIDDSVFNLSRTLLGLATLFGVALTLMFTTSVYWESINLKPIGIGFLITYFFQSFSMLFFDTDLCSQYSCKMGPGGVLCIVASFCWMAACVGTAKMDSFKLRAIRARRRAARKKAKQERKRRKEFKKKIAMARMASMNSTTSTESTKTSTEENREEMKALGLYTC